MGIGAPQCYRHPGRETWISCQRCGRPICPDCMVSASVGFQCPECVNEGKRSVRPARSPFGGARVGTPGAATITLIGANVVVWLAILVTGGAASHLVDVLAISPVSRCDVAGLSNTTACLSRFPAVADGGFWQVITSAFTHVEPVHIFFNMLALWFIGPALEQILGHVRFVALYLISAVCGSAAVMLFATPIEPTVGASGAIFGLLGALFVVGRKLGGDTRQVAVWIVLNLVLTFTIPNVSWQGHIGGLIGGAAAGAVIAYAPRANRTMLQIAGLSAITVVALALIAVRAASLVA